MERPNTSSPPYRWRRHLAGKLLSASAVATLLVGLVSTGAPSALAGGAPGNNGLNPTGNGTTSNAKVEDSLAAAADSAQMAGGKGQSSLTCSGNSAQVATGSFTLTKTLDVGSVIVVYLVPNNGSNANPPDNVAKNQTSVTLTNADNTTGSVINWSIPITSGFTVSKGGILGVFAVNADYQTAISSSKTYSLNCTESTSFQPSISTMATSSTSGGAITDSATLTGTAQGSTAGTITFTAYGPEASATCAPGDVAYTTTVSVSGDGTYGPVSFTPTKAGTYYWIASYSGDPSTSTLSVSGTCGDTGEASSFSSPASPTLGTTPSAGGAIGTVLNDTATLTGATSPTGSITFNLYGPNDETCSNEPIYTQTVALSGSSATTSPGFTTTAAGTYEWTASYAGDGNNKPASSGCGDESVVIASPPPPGQGYFQFTKVVGGNVTDWAGGEFTFTVTCGDRAGIPVTLTVGPSGALVSSQPFGPYDAGTVCTVTEGSMPAAGTYATWVNSPTYSPTSGSQTIVSDATVTVAVTDTRSYSPPLQPSYGYFQFFKALAGNLTGWTGGTFQFTVTCGGTSTSVSLPVGADGKTVTSNVFGPFTPGTTCSVTEGSLPSAGTDASWVNSPSYSASSVTIPANQTATITVTNTRSYTPPTPTPTPTPKPKPTPAATGGVAGATGTPSLPPTTSLPGQGGGPNGIIFLLLGALGAASMVLITTTQLRKRLLDSIDQ